MDGEGLELRVGYSVARVSISEAGKGGRGVLSEGGVRGVEEVGPCCQIGNWRSISDHWLRE